MKSRKLDIGQVLVLRVYGPGQQKNDQANILPSRSNKDVLNGKRTLFP